MSSVINPKLLEYVDFLKNFVSRHQSFFDNLYNFKESKDEDEKEDEKVPSPFDYLDNVSSTHPKSPYGLKEFTQLQNEFYDIFIAPYNSAIIKFQGHMAEYDGKTLLEAGNTEAEWYNYFSKESILGNMQISLICNAISVAKFPMQNIRNTSITPFGYVPNGIELNEGLACPFCNQRIGNVVLNYDTLEITPFRAIVQHCPNTKKSISKIKLSVPSKKLVFLNDIRHAFKVKPESEISINSTLGKMQQTEIYAEHNIGYFFVSNTSPTILQKEGSILIDTNYFDNQDEEDNNKHQKEYKDYIDKGYICTDLWWYFVLDFDLYSQLCANANLSPDYFSHTVVDITSSKVKISHDLDKLISKITYAKK